MQGVGLPVSVSVCVYCTYQIVLPPFRSSTQSAISNLGRQKLPRRQEILQSAFDTHQWNDEVRRKTGIFPVDSPADVLAPPFCVIVDLFPPC